MKRCAHINYFMSQISSKLNEVWGKKVEKMVKKRNKKRNKLFKKENKQKTVKKLKYEKISKCYLFHVMDLIN